MCSRRARWCRKCWRAGPAISSTPHPPRGCSPRSTRCPTAARVDGVLQPEEVARMVIEAMEEERFLILSHPTVQEYIQRKAANRDRWLSGMRRLRDKIYGPTTQV